MLIDLQSLLFLMIFSSVAYLIVTEEHFLHFVALLSKRVGISIERVYWLVRLHPIISNNFIARWMMYRKHLKIAKELEQEFNDKLRQTD